MVRSKLYLAASEQGLLLLEILSHWDVCIFLHGKPLSLFTVNNGMATLMNSLRPPIWRRASPPPGRGSEEIQILAEGRWRDHR